MSKLRELVGRQYYNTETKIVGEIISFDRRSVGHNFFGILYEDGEVEPISSLWMMDKMQKGILIDPPGYNSPLWKVLNGVSVEDK